MVTASIELAWWPPDPDEPIGEDRALELVTALQAVATPVVEDAAADLRRRLEPGTEIVRSGAPALYVARIRFGPEMASLCVGTVYQVSGGDPESNSIQLGRDGVLRWRRD